LRIKVLPEQVEDFAQDWIAQRVIDLVPALAADNHLLGPQDGEVLGQVGLFKPQPVEQDARAQFALAQEIRRWQCGWDGQAPGRCRP
jgi:hypothetical protein